MWEGKVLAVRVLGGLYLEDSLRLPMMGGLWGLSCKGHGGGSLTCCALARQLFHHIYRQPDTVRLLAQQAGWQDVLTRLYVLEAATADSPLPFAPEPLTSPEPDLPKPPTESPESSDVFLPSETPCPDPDAFYHALSPFCAPLDLGLERASVGSGNTAGGGSDSGTVTPASQPGTPSPLDGPRPFPAAHGHHSSSLSNVLEDGSLPEPTVSGDDTSNASNPQVNSPTLCHGRALVGRHLRTWGRHLSKGVGLPDIRIAGACQAQCYPLRVLIYSYVPSLVPE